jgi:CO dehydrogenase maturation factor
MKISVCGKGGSGKSTITTLLAFALRDRGYHPLIVDTDESNSVLYRMLGMSNPPEPLVSLAGGRQMVRKLMPPGYKPADSFEPTNVLVQSSISLDDIPKINLVEHQGVSLVIVGKITESLEGCACPMGVLGKEFLGKLKLNDREIVIADMEAGIEHFGRGVEASLDGVLVVVDPSFESIKLAERIQALANGIGINQVWALFNKVNSDKTKNRLQRELEKTNVKVVGLIPYSEDVFNAGLEGVTLQLPPGNLREAMDGILDKILACSQDIKPG